MRSTSSLARAEAELRRLYAQRAAIPEIEHIVSATGWRAVYVDVSDDDFDPDREYRDDELGDSASCSVLPVVMWIAALDEDGEREIVPLLVERAPSPTLFVGRTQDLDLGRLITLLAPGEEFSQEDRNREIRAEMHRARGLIHQGKKP